MGFVAEQRGELAHADRQVAVALDALVEDLHVAGAVHRLDRHLPVVVGADGEHVVAVLIPVPGFFPQDAVHQLRRGHLFVAVLDHLVADVVFQVLAQTPALGVPEHAAHRFLLDMEQTHFPGQFAVVALFRFLELLEVGVEFLLVAPGGAVDTLQLGVVRVAAPVGAGHLHQFEAVAELAGGGQVRAPAQVDEIALAVQGHLLVGGQVADDLGLELLALLEEEGDRFVAVPDFTADVFVTAHDLLHALFDRTQVVRGKGRFPVEVVIKAVLDGRTDGHLGVREQFLHRFGHHMGGVVANQFQSVFVLTGDDLHFAAVGERQVHIRETTVGFRRQGLFGEFLADPSGDLQGGGRLIKLHSCPVGQSIAHAHG